MKDHQGIYYYPFPENRRVRMYVREDAGDIWFRMWNADDPGLWKDHGWVPHEAIRQAAKLYQGKGFDPNRAYDPRTARRVIREALLP